METSPKHIILLLIVVPVYNAMEFIRSTLVSLIRIVHNRNDIEIIIQDSCSTDGTSPIVQDFCYRYGFMHHYVEKDKGQSDGINRGVQKARGEWVTWLCADDLLLGSFTSSMNLLQHTTADVVYGDCIFLLQDGQIVPAIGTEDYRNAVLIKRRMILQQPGTCIRKGAWDNVRGVDTKLNWTMDYDLFLRLEARKAKFQRVFLFISVARIRPDAKTSSGSTKRLLEHWQVLLRAGLLNASSASIRPYLLYFVEYMIKRLESKQKYRGISKLHRLFWLIGKPAEQDQIQTRFKEQK
ncbi:MAG TPA: glycosyltransferase, partial [Saccharofermentans sp.]|nr:glycosyltransferase [Saccharofermentans sp.]